jgi:trigger factor
MEAEDQYVELGANRFIPGFEEQLEGAQPGEERTVEVTFPEEYQNSQLAGRTATFQVTVKELREPQPVELDDSLAQKFGEDSLDSLKERVREQIRSEYDSVTRQRTKRQLLDQLSEGHSFEVPPSMVDSEFEQIWQQIEHDREHGHLDAEDQAKSEEQLKEDYRQIAERRVRLGLLLSEVGRHQNIDVTQEELNQGLVEEMKRYPGREREVFEYYQNNQDALQNLRAPIYEDKVIDYILESAQSEERHLTSEELRQELEREHGGGESGAAESGDGSDEAGSKSAGAAATSSTDERAEAGGSQTDQSA